MNTRNDAGDPIPDPLSTILEEFIGLHEVDPEHSPTTFAQRYPEHLRVQIIQDCESYLRQLKLFDTKSESQTLPSTLGPFELRDKLGSGGMASVWRALDTRTNDEAAVKVLHPHLCESFSDVARFRQEFAIGKDLHHPHLLWLKELEKSENQLYIVLSHLMKESLADQLAKADVNSLPSEGSGGPGSFRHSAQVVRDISQALGYLHSKEVDHRDVKPHNILLDSAGRARLSDFGLARIRSRVAPSLTRTGQVVGTPFYMSPEQARCRSYGVDHRTDLYSLGVVLFELLTHQRPFHSDSQEDLLYKITFQSTPLASQLNPAVPPDLETICLKAMEKSPSHRYQSAREMTADLELWLDKKPIITKRPGRVRQKARVTALQMRKPMVRYLSVGILLLGSVLLTSWLKSGPPSPQPPTASVALGLSQDVQIQAQPWDLDAEHYGTLKSMNLNRDGALTLEPGQWRIRFEFQNKLREVEAFLIEGDTLDFRQGLAAAAGESLDSPEADEEMITIDDDRDFIIGSGTRENKRYWRRTVSALPAFRIDKYEVTNRRYMRFVLATGHRPALFWPSDWQSASSPPWIDLPVVGVTYSDAQAFCRWAGKRLPTYREWQRAGRSTDGRRFAWGNDDQDVASRAVIGRSDPKPTTRVTTWERSSEALIRVGEDTEDVSPNGVFHLCGNVREWIDSPSVIKARGQFGYSWNSRLVMGGGWADSLEYANFGHMINAPSEILPRHAYTGFRCAMSIKPTN